LATTDVTLETFEETVSKDGIVFVDFWAEWCGPCRMIAPVLEEIAASQENLQIVKLNIDENPATPAQYRVTSIPALNVYSGGEVVKQIIGAKPKAKLLEELNEYVS